MMRKLISVKEALVGTPTWQMFGLYALLYVLLIFCVEEFVYYDPSYFTGGNQNSVTLYRNVFKFIYGVIPFFLIVRFVFFQQLIKYALPDAYRDKVSQTLVLKLLISGSFILLIPYFVKVLWFMFVDSTYTMEEAVRFELFSLYQFSSTLISTEAYDYLLKQINVFELLFVFYVAWGIILITRKSIRSNLQYVLKGYVIPILIYASIKILINVFILNF